MPGTFVISPAETFSALLLMSSGAKTEFGTSEQAVSAAGEKKWEAQVAATWRQEPAALAAGRRPVAEVITVTITGGATDPAAGIAPGSPVELDGFRVGVSTPEKTERGGLRGGKPWYSATAIRSLNGHRPKTD